MAASNIFEKWKSWAPQLHAILRITSAFFFIQSGTMKLFAIPIGMPPDNSTAQLFTQVGLAGILEAFGGLLVFLGLFTRPVSFILSGEMAVAYFQGHFPQGFWPVENGGYAAVLYCFLFLYFSSAGPGAWSVDEAWKKRRQH